MATGNRLVCLLVLCALALAAGCAGKKQEEDPAQSMLNGISGNWKIDLAALVKEWPEAAEEMQTLGKEEFAARYGQIGFSLDAQKQLIEFHDPEVAVVSKGPQAFTLVPPDSSRAGGAYESADEVRLKLENREEVLAFRYAGGGRERVYFSVDDAPAVVFVRQK